MLESTEEPLKPPRVKHEIFHVGTVVVNRCSEGMFVSGPSHESALLVTFRDPRLRGMDLSDAAAR